MENQNFNFNSKKSVYINHILGGSFYSPAVLLDQQIFPNNDSKKISWNAFGEFEETLLDGRKTLQTRTGTSPLGMITQGCFIYIHQNI